MKKLIYIIAICIFLLGFTNALKSQECYWSANAGGALIDKATENVFDRNGNYYIAGYTRSFPCYFQTDTIPYGSFETMFLLKYNPMGKEEWVYEIGSYSAYYPEEIYGSIGGLEMDTVLNHLIVFGKFYYSVALPDTVLFTDYVACFLAKLNPDGHTLWAKTIPAIGDYPDIDAYDVTVDPQSNIYVSGACNTETGFSGLTIPRGGFIAKYNPKGEVIWAKIITEVKQFTDPGASDAPPLNLCYQDNQLYVNGRILADTVKIDTIIAYPNCITFYLARFDPSGTIKGVTVGGGDKSFPGTQIAADKSGNVYLSGIFDSDTGFFGKDTILNHASYCDCYLSKVDRNGEFIWTKQLFATRQGWGRGLAVDKKANVYLSGTFSGDIRCGEEIITSGSASDMFIAKFSSEGECLGIHHYSDGDIPRISIDQEGNIGMAGSFKKTLDIGGNLLISYGESDLFAAKCAPITGIPQPLESPQAELMIYANPTTGQCNITIPEPFRQEKELRLQIYDQTGKLVQEARMELAGETVKLDIRAQAKGLYLAVLTNGRRSYSGKIVFE